MKHILITGISSGVGFGLAKHYLQLGHQVYGISRNRNEKLEAYAKFSFLSQDLSQFDEMKKNISGFLREVDHLDLVVLNAGILNEVKDMKDSSLEEIQKVMDVNVWANKLLIDLLFEQVNQIKQLVAISSGASVSGSRGWNAYALSKATLNMLIELYSKELPDCHLSALAPGLIESSMQDYIKSLPEEAAKKFPVVQKLKEARGTPSMPSPEKAAIIISDAIEKAVNHDSGSFLDVREI